MSSSLLVKRPEEKNLPLKVLFRMAIASAPPLSLDKKLVGKHSFIKVMFLPPNTTPPLIQLMDKLAISNSKMMYLQMFQKCFKVNNDTEVTLGNFWKNHYNILHCLRITDKVQCGVSRRTMDSAWK